MVSIKEPRWSTVLVIYKLTKYVQLGNFRSERISVICDFKEKKFGLSLSTLFKTVLPECTACKIMWLLTTHSVSFQPSYQYST